MATRTSETVREEICRLKNKLSSNVSSIGDYKIVKTFEARLQAADDPYDTDTLIADRQAVRDEINTLMEELEELEASEAASGTTATA